MTRGWARPTLAIYECEGHGRYFEVYEGEQYVGEYDTGIEVCERFAGRAALVYGYEAYDQACAGIVAADPHGFDLSDVRPDPELCIVRHPATARLLSEGVKR